MCALCPLGTADIFRMGTLSVERVQPSEMSYKIFYEFFLLANRPCVVVDIMKSWPCYSDWVLADGQLNECFLLSKFGEAIVPVSDSSNSKEYGSGRTTTTFENYLASLEEDQCCRKPYLKDWHFQRYGK